jgi:hypothetical protein
MPVSTQHPEYTAHVATWQRNRDAVAGQDAIKAGGTRYLPQPNPQDESDANRARYARYLERALWYAAPERTKNSLIGAVFRKGPQSQEVPTQVEYLIENADGAGVSLEQLGKEIIGELLEVGRLGLLVDFPRAEPGATIEQARDLTANISLYPAESVVNWRFDVVGGDRKLTLVVLKEQRVVADDGYEQETEDQFRVLRLENGSYTQQLFDDAGDPIGDVIEPLDASGARWSEIPFVIVGSENNRPDVDRAPLSHLCNQAVAYWQTSADHRENLYLHGQLTLGVTSDMPHDEFQKANPAGIVIGAPYGVFLGESGGFHTATAPESSSLSKALEDLRLEMAELGAQIIQKGAQNQTAEAARIDAAAESSVLSNVVGNASEGIEQALEWACIFMGGDPEAVEYRLNTEFFDHSIDPQQRVALMAEWQSGIIAKSDVRRALRRADVIEAERTDEEIDAELATEAPRMTGDPLELGDDA